MGTTGISRRKFFQGAAATGAAGLVVGGGAGLVLGGGEDSSEGGSGSSGKPINIGTPLPLSGDLAGDGEEARRGSVLAVEEINAAGGIFGRPIKHHIADMGDTSPDKVRSAFSLLVDQRKVDAIVMPYLFASGPDFDVVSKAQVPYIHHNALSDSVDRVRKDFEKYWMIFQHNPTERPHGVGLYPVLEKLEADGAWKPRAKTVFIVTSDSSYSSLIAKLMRDGAKSRGWRVVGFERVTSPFTQWGAILKKIRAANPDVIFNTDQVVGDVAAFQNQFMTDPTDSLMYQQYAPSVPEYLELTGKRSNGVIWATVQGMIDSDEIGKSFIKRYTDRWKEAPGGSTAPAIYDSMHIYADAVRRAGGPEDRRRVADQLRATIYRGVTGTHSFDPKDNHVPAFPGEVADPSLGMPHMYVQIQNGKQVTISPEPYVTGKYLKPSWL